MHGLEEQVGRTMGARKGEAEVADTGGCAADHLECSGGTLRHHFDAVWREVRCTAVEKKSR